MISIVLSHYDSVTLWWYCDTVTLWHCDTTLQCVTEILTVEAGWSVPGVTVCSHILTLCRPAQDWSGAGGDWLAQTCTHQLIRYQPSVCEDKSGPSQSRPGKICLNFSVRRQATVRPQSSHSQARFNCSLETKLSLSSSRGGGRVSPLITLSNEFLMLTGSRSSLLQTDKWQKYVYQHQPGRPETANR